MTEGAGSPLRMRPQQSPVRGISQEIEQCVQEF